MKHLSLLSRLVILVMPVLIINCKERNTSEVEGNESLELKEKELELRERELAIELREREIENLNVESEKLQSQETRSLSELFQEAKKGVYLIYTISELGVSQGSAFVVDESGLAISNYHVFENASSAIAVNEFGAEFMITEIVDFSQENDYIIFRLGNENRIPHLPISNSVPLVGEACFAIGNPKGLTQTLSTGIISGYRNGNAMLQTTAEITHGSSGGPLFNQRGEVVGITTSGFGEANLNFAINIQNIPIFKYLGNFNQHLNIKSLSREDIEFILRNYFRTIENESWNELANYYPSYLNRFYDRFNISRKDAVNSARSYKSKFEILKTKHEIRWSTLEFSNSDQGTTAHFTMDYSLERVNKSKPSKFVLEMVVLIDAENKIKSIYENILMSK